MAMLVVLAFSGRRSSWSTLEVLVYFLVTEGWGAVPFRFSCPVIAFSINIEVYNSRSFFKLL